MKHLIVILLSIVALSGCSTLFNKQPAQKREPIYLISSNPVQTLTVKQRIAQTRETDRQNCLELTHDSVFCAILIK